MSKSALAVELSRRSLEEQEKVALKMSYRQLASLEGIEEFRDLLNSRDFWTKKILHNFPDQNQEELSLYNASQLQARYYRSNQTS